eukprot:scaffold844_cov139-Isochrysis_galbana.AAC.2
MAFRLEQDLDMNDERGGGVDPCREWRCERSGAGIHARADGQAHAGVALVGAAAMPSTARPERIAAAVCCAALQRANIAPTQCAERAPQFIGVMNSGFGSVKGDSLSASSGRGSGLADDMPKVNFGGELPYLRN